MSIPEARLLLSGHASLITTHISETNSDRDLRLIFPDGSVSLHRQILLAAVDRNLANIIKEADDDEVSIIIPDSSVAEARVLAQILYHGEVITESQEDPFQTLSSLLGLKKFDLSWVKLEKVSPKLTSPKKVLPMKRKSEELIRKSARKRKKNTKYEVEDAAIDLNNDDSLNDKLEIVINHSEKKEIAPIKEEVAKNVGEPLTQSLWKDNFGFESLYKRCYICTKTFIGLHSFTKHLRSHGKHQGNYKCPVCQESNLPHGLAVHEHVRLHVRGLLSDGGHQFIRCTEPSCKKRAFKTVSALNRHLTHEHALSRGTSYKCQECEEVFTNARQFSTHMVEKHNKKPFECEVCGRRYMNKVGLEEHLSAKHSGDQFQCDICQKKLSSKSGLMAHRKEQHLQENSRNIQCDVCGFVSKGIRNLRKHKKKHDLNRVKKYMCSYCSLSFTSKFCVVTHERTHTGEAPYRCNVCHTNFRRSHHLKSHLSTMNHANKIKQLETEGTDMPEQVSVIDSRGTKPVKLKSNAVKSVESIVEESQSFTVEDIGGEQILMAITDMGNNQADLQNAVLLAQTEEYTQFIME